MNFNLFEMLNLIYMKLDGYGYSELDEYECGLKDILNLLDCRMSGNDEIEMFNDIMETINRNHEKIED